MKVCRNSRFAQGALLGAASLCAFLLVGCSSQPLPTAEEQAQEAASDKKSTLGRAMEKGTDFETDSNISQINSVLGQIKSDSDGQAPPTLEAAKAAVKVPDEMWIDKSTGKPLVYDSTTGTVSKAP